MSKIQIFQFLSQAKKISFVCFSLFFLGAFCQPLHLGHAGDFDSHEYYKTQLLACLLKGSACNSNKLVSNPSETASSTSIAIRPLVQFDFTNGSLANSGSVVIAPLTNQEAPATMTLGKDGDTNGAYLYATNNQYFTASDTGLPTGASPRTMCAWIKPSALPVGAAHHMVFRYGNTSAANASVLSLSNSAGNEVSFLGSSYDAFASYTMPLNTWSHLCATFNGGTTASLYVNGALLASPSLIGTGPLNTTPGSFVIGTWTGSGGLAYYWRGALDDVRIYDIALSATQIGQIYSTGAAY